MERPTTTMTMMTTMSAQPDLFLNRPLLITNSCMEALTQLIRTGPGRHTHLVFDEFDFAKAHTDLEHLEFHHPLNL